MLWNAEKSRTKDEPIIHSIHPLRCYERREKTKKKTKKNKTPTFVGVSFDNSRVVWPGIRLG